MIDKSVIDKSIIDKSIEHYGKDIQTTVCMEECAELIQAISKMKRNKGDLSHLTEEIADVLICIEILKQVYKVSEYELSVWIETKQLRIANRMRRDENAE